MKLTLRQRFLNLPNYITFGRLVAVGVVMLILIFIDHNHRYEAANRTLSFVAALLFVIAMLSDILDGYLARKQKIVSTFGQFFDPLADKLLFLVAMIFMVELGRLPAWIVCIFLAREVIVTALRGVAIDEGIVIAASHWGKYKSAFISCAAVALLLHYPFWGIHFRLIGWVLIWPALFASIASGVHYLWAFIHELKKLDQKNNSPTRM